MRNFLVLMAFTVFIALSITLKTSTPPKVETAWQSEILITGLNHPWSFIWLNKKQILLTERNGDLLLFDEGKKIPLTLELDIYAHGQGGLLDLALHPNYQKNGWIYLSYSKDKLKGASTAVSRFKIKNKAITNHQLLYQAKPYINSSHHFGGRLVFDNNHYLYLSVGDRGKRHFAQQTNNDIGKILRLHDDGRIPEDNPFSNAIYSYGHRNPQGLININGNIIAHEHGPRGGDEINIINRGVNYGWPVISYGREYISNKPVGIGTHKQGMAQPLYQWTPSIAPSGLAYYGTDDANTKKTGIKQWENNLLVGSLKFKQLVRLVLKNNQVIEEERLLTNVFGRIRDVKVKGGTIYLLIDSSQGQLIKLHHY